MRGQPGWPRNNGLTSLVSIFPKEDNLGTLSETYQPPSLHIHLVTLFKVVLPDRLHTFLCGLLNINKWPHSLYILFW